MEATFKIFIVMFKIHTITFTSKSLTNLLKIKLQHARKSSFTVTSMLFCSINLISLLKKARFWEIYTRPVLAGSGSPREIFFSPQGRFSKVRSQCKRTNVCKISATIEGSMEQSARVQKLPVSLLCNSYTDCHLTFTFLYNAMTSACIFTCAKSQLHNCIPLCPSLDKQGNIPRCL